ncbi:MAG: hypothetical protein GY795_43915 [Desulfobacterales bacterium]|nr:hypothetical protein [Desulfobacterales bacterium]
MKFWQIPGFSAKISFRHSSVCQPENEGCPFFIQNLDKACYLSYAVTKTIWKIVLQ